MLLPLSYLFLPSSIQAMRADKGTKRPRIPCDTKCFQRTGLASFGGARGLLGTLKGRSGEGGKIMTGHQQSCCSSTYSSAALSEPFWAP